MNQSFEKSAKSFIENTISFAELQAKPFSLDLTKDQLISQIQYISEQGQKASRANSYFLDHHLFPLLANAENFTSEHIESLVPFAEEVSKIDPFIATEIYKSLASHAKSIGNMDAQIDYTYQLAKLYSFLNGNSFSALALECIREILDVAPDYMRVESAETRSAIAGLHTLLCVNAYNDPSCGFHDLFSCISQAESFFVRDDVRTKDPDFPWHSYDARLKQCKIGIGSLCEFGRNEKIPEDFAKEQYEYISKALNPDTLHKLKDAPQQERLAFLREQMTLGAPGLDFLAWAESAYHSHNLSLKKYLDIIFSLASTTIGTPPGVGKDQFPYAAHCRMQVAVAAVGILGKYYDKVDDRHKILYQNISLDIENWLVNEQPQDVLNTVISVSEELKSVARLCAQRNHDSSGYSHFLLKANAHIPTYAHSLMVAELTKLTFENEKVFEYLIEKHPQTLEKLLADSPEKDFKKARPYLVAKIADAAFAHDVGKIVYRQAVARIARKLTDFEFKHLIAEHPTAGAAFFDETEYELYHDIANGHHKFVDDSRGYPSNFSISASPFYPIISAVTLADIEDAATDPFRAYQNTKEHNAIWNELIEGSKPSKDGITRYNPELVEIISSQPDLMEARNNLLSKSHREDMYYKAYLALTTPHVLEKSEPISAQTQASPSNQQPVLV